MNIKLLKRIQTATQVLRIKRSSFFLRLCIISYLGLLYILTGTCSAAIILFFPSAHSFQYLHTLNPSTGYQVSYSRHKKFVHGLKISSAASVLVMACIVAFESFILTPHSVFAINPTFTGTIPALLINEDATTSNVVTLNNYFTPNTGSCTYTAPNGLLLGTMTINANSTVDVTSTATSGGYMTINDTTNVLLLHGDGSNASTTFTDFSLQTKTLTVAGNAQLSTAQSKFGGSSMVFDGTGDYLTIPNSSSWSFGTGDFTMETWVKTSQNASNVGVITFQDNFDADNWSFDITNGKFEWWAGVYSASSALLTSTTSVNDNVWHHLAVSRSSGTTRLFVDGVQEASTTTVWNHTTNASALLYVGYYSGATASRAFNGYMDDVRITKGTALYTANFTAPTTALPDPGIVSRIFDAGTSTSWSTLAWVPMAPYLKNLPNSVAVETAYNGSNADMSNNVLLLHMDESSGTVADSSGSSHNATAAGAVTYSTTSPLNTGLTFSSGTGYLSITDHADFNLTGDFTLETWAKFNSTAGTQYLLGHDTGSGTTNKWIFWYDAGNLGFHIQPGNTTLFNYAWAPTVGQWYHLAVTRSGNSWTLYVNGASVSTATNSIGIADPNAAFTIGEAEGGGFFYGALDEVALLKRALSTTEILNTYKRAAVKLKYQVRSCDDAACSGESFVGPGTATDASNAALDFDVADEGQFTQEDATNGTDFASGLASLHTNDSNVKLLIHADGTNNSTTFTDSSVNARTITTNGDAKISTAQSKFGSASSLFDGTGDYLSVADSEDFNFGSGDFTIEGWYRFVSTSGVKSLWGQNQGGGSVPKQTMLYNYPSAGQLTVGRTTGVGDSNEYTINVTLNADQWYNVALVRNNNSLLFFIDGTLSGTVDITGKSFPSVSAPFMIGTEGESYAWHNGYIDEFRLSKGVARYTANFTPSASAFDNPGYTTTQPYYVTTSASNNFSLSGINSITSLAITKTEPTNTTILGLVSFDGRTTWKYYSASAWQTASGGLADLQTSGMTVTALQNAFASWTPSGQASLDFAFDLSSTDGTATPSLDLITINYTTLANTTGTYYSELTNSAITLPSSSLGTGIANNRYFQYKTFFNSDNTSYLPGLNSVTITAGNGTYSDSSNTASGFAGGTLTALGYTKGNSDTVQFQCTDGGAGTVVSNTAIVAYRHSSFTATTTGNWNVGTTWGYSCTSDCIEGSDYPSSTSTATVPSGITVTVPTGTTASFSTLTIAGSVTLTGNVGTGTNITIQNGGTFTQNNAAQQVLSGALTIQNGGNLTHTANTTTAGGKQFGVNFSTATIDVQSGGSVNVNGKGFQTDNGTAAGNPYTGVNNSGGGAAYGGYGGASAGGGGAEKATAYGSVTAPVSIGSGGGSGYNGGAGGAGGGAVQLAVTGNAVISGTITANADNGGGSSGLDGGGGGSGGSIYITVAGSSALNMSSAIIRANGGKGADSNLDGGGGGGGRVALIYASGTYTAPTTLQAFGGQSLGAADGGTGSIYVKSSANNGTVTYDNASAWDGSAIADSTDGTSTVLTASESNTITELILKNGAALIIPDATTLTTNQTTFSNVGTTATLTVTGTFNPGNTSLTIPAGVTATFSSTGTLSTTTTLVVDGAATLTYGLTKSLTDVTVNNAATLTLDSYTTTALALTNLTVNTGGILTQTANTNGTENHKINISVSNAATIAGTINANGKGAPGNAGTAAGNQYTGLNNSGGGAAHGGYGGASAGGGGAEKATAYGSIIAPTNMGSGGGRGYNGGVGGTGGGAIQLAVTGNAVISGTITANADNGAGSGGLDGGGGGSGGSVYITVAGSSALNMSGATIRANGGKGADSNLDGGGGGGGRVALIYGSGTYTAPTTLQAFGGQSLGAADGGTGSIYVKSSSNNGTVTYDNGSAWDGSAIASSTDGTSSTLIAGTNTVVSGLVLSNYEALILPVTSITTADTTLSICSTCTLTMDGFTNASTALSVGTLTVNGTLKHSDHTTDNAVLAHKIKIAATTVAVGSAGTINVDGLGFAGRASNTAGLGSGAGAAGSGTIGGAGGGYGAAGGNGSGSSTPTGIGGVANGSSTAPVDLGSSGGGSNNASATGGDGAGAIEISATNTFTLDGSINARGAAGTVGSGYGGGGGAGGSIYITTATLTGAGSISVIGGTGGNGSTTKGGGGAGGRVAIIGLAGSNGFTGTHAETGGTATSTAQDGGAGTYTIGSITPLVTLSTIAQQTDDKRVNINYTLADADTASQTVNLYEYSRDNSTWATMTAATGDGAHEGVSSLSSNAGGAAHVFVWAACTDISGVYDASVHIRLRANDGTANSSTATSSAFAVDCANPTGLGSFATGTATFTTMPLTWTAAVDETFNHYDIWYGTDATAVNNRTATQWGTAQASNLSTISTAATTITGLTVNTTYYFKIWAIDNFSNEQTVTAISATTSNYAVSNQPSISSPSSGQASMAMNPAVSSSAYSGEGIHLSSDWQIYDNASPTYSDDNTSTNLVWYKFDDSTNKTSITANTTNGTFQNARSGQATLASGTTYYVRVRHTNSGGDSTWSSAVSFRTISNGTFVSTQTGDWNIGTTWGEACTSACSEGTDYPGASSVVTVASGHTVTVPAAITGNFTTLTIAGVVTSSGSASGTTLNISSGGTVNLASAKTITATTINVTGNLGLTGNLGTVTNINILSGGVLTQNNTTQQVISGTLNVQSGGTLTHGNNTTSQTNEVDFSAATITVAGTVQGNALGYDAQTGTGGGSGTVGAYHGGYGGYWDTAANVGTYDSITQPALLGSGGGTSNAASGGKGGGFVSLVSSGNTTISGTVSVNGGAGGSTGGGNGYAAGGGSGGSVYINAAGNLVTNSGTIVANGGSGGSASVRWGGGGGGGRIALIYGGVYSSTSATLTSYGGDGPSLAKSGGAGSLYVDGPGASDTTLTYDNNTLADGIGSAMPVASYTATTTQISNGANVTLPAGATLTTSQSTFGNIGSGATFIISGTFNPGNSAFTFPASMTVTLNDSATLATVTTATINGNVTIKNGITESFGAITIGNGGVLTQDSYTNASTALGITSLTINSGGLFTHTANTTSLAHKIKLAASTVTVNTGGSINVNGKGYSGGQTAGANGSGINFGMGLGSISVSGGGGGHGGAGGRAGAGGNGGSLYGVMNAPIDLGSGGGSGNHIDADGGAGGGSVQITTTGLFTLGGNIVSNGTNGTAAGGHGGGGGAGGSVYLTVGSFAGTGSISALGGSGGNGATSDGGGGAGGRVVVTGASLTGTFVLTGGLGPDTALDGMMGTFYPAGDYTGSTMAPSDAAPFIGNTVIYTATLANSSDVSGESVVFTMTPPSGTTYVTGSMKINNISKTDASDSDEGVYNSGTNTITVTMTDIPAGGSVILKFNLAVASGQDHGTVISPEGTITANGSTTTVSTGITVTGGKFTNVPTGLGVKLGTDTSVDLSSTRKTGSQLVDFTKGSSNIAKFNVNLDAERALDSVNWDINTTDKKAFFHGFSDLAGVQDSTYTLYIPHTDGDSAATVRLCVGAESLDQIAAGCDALYSGVTGENVFSNGEIWNGITCTINETTDQWECSGVTGTGGGEIPSDNDAPVATTPSITSQAVDASGYVTFTTRISDADNDNTLMKVEYSEDGGTTWYDPYLVSATPNSGTISLDNAAAYQVGTTDAIDSSGGVKTLTVVWNTLSTSNGNGAVSGDQSDIIVRVTPNDTYVDGTAATSAAFETDNQVPTGLASLAVSSATATTATLTWTAATETNFNHYELWYGTTSSAVDNRTGTEWDNSDDTTLATRTTTTTTISGLTPAATYYYKIWAVDNFNNEATIANISSTIPGVTPTTPTQSSPTNNQTGVSANPTITGSSYTSTESSTHAATDWQISDDGTFSDNDCSDTNIVWCKLNDTSNKTSTTVNSSSGSFQNTLVSQTRLTQNSYYYCRFRYISNTSGQSSWSSPLRFGVGNSTPAYVAATNSQPRTVSFSEDAGGTASYDLDELFSDSGDTCTYSVSDAPTTSIATSINSTTNVVTFTPAANYNGTDTITFRCTDSQGATVDSEAITITVASVNDAPVASAGSDLTVGAGEDEIELDASQSSDLDGGDTTLTYAWEIIEDGSHIGGCGLKDFDSATPILQILERIASGYTCTVQVTVSDGTASATDTIIISVDPAAAQFTGTLPNLSIPAGTSMVTFDLDDYFITAEGMELTYSVTGNTHIEVIINDDGTVEIVIPDDFVGTETIIFRALTPIGDVIVSNPIVITIEPVLDQNDAVCGSTVLRDIALAKGSSRGKGIIKLYSGANEFLRKWKAFHEAGVIPLLTSIEEKVRIFAIKSRTGTTLHVYNACGKVLKKKRLSPQLHWRRFALAELDRSTATKEIVVATQRDHNVYIKIYSYNDAAKVFRVKWRARYVGVQRGYYLRVKKRYILLYNRQDKLVARWKVGRL